MATDFLPLNSLDTKELRKELGLPITKELFYWRKENMRWDSNLVVDYKIVETYMPSGSKSLLITLNSGEEIRILADYLSDMQKPSFFSDSDCDEENDKESIDGKFGKRIEGDFDSYVVVDLETTGTNHFCDQITEIGAIKYIGGIEVERFNVLVKTEIPIPHKIEELTGITNAMLEKEGISIDAAIKTFFNFVGDDIIVGHNFSAFDSKFLEDAYENNLKRRFPNDYVDTLILARKKLPELCKHSLEELSNYYGIDYTKAHRAIADCIVNHLVYEFITFGNLLSDDSAEGFLLNNDKFSKVDLSDFADDSLEDIEITDDWEVLLSEQFPNIIHTYDLTDDSISIMANYGKNGNVSSYAICIYEPDIVEDKKSSSRFTTVARIKPDVLKSNPNIVSVDSRNEGLSKYGNVIDSVNGRYTIRMDLTSPDFAECLVDCLIYGIKNYVPKASKFACCARFEECSKTGRCIHPNILYAKACVYRKNLESGSIFY